MPEDWPLKILHEFSINVRENNTSTLTPECTCHENGNNKQNADDNN